jgi:hypothetical protein
MWALPPPVPPGIFETFFPPQFSKKFQKNSRLSRLAAGFISSIRRMKYLFYLSSWTGTHQADARAVFVAHRVHAAENGGRDVRLWMHLP